MKAGAVRRYLTVVGIILALVIGAGVWLKPPLQKLRENVDEGLKDYALTHMKPGETTPAVTYQESNDWVIATRHVAKIDDQTFYCIGAFKVTVCDFTR